MFSVLVAALVAAASPPDTVFTVDGGRITGNVMEESATAGVTIETPDGSVRRIERSQVSRVEYADGTVSPPRPPPPAVPAPAQRAKPGEGPSDTVFFVGGGRVRGTVIEENPRSGVRVRQLDGTYQTYARDDVARIEYGDGTVSVIAPPPAPPPAPAPAAAPAPEAQRPYPVYLTLGLGATFLGGDATREVKMSDVFALEQAHVSTELGLRLTPGWALGVYADAGGGDPASVVGKQCDAQGWTCTAATGRIGLLVRHTWDPISSRPIWMTLGTGWEFGAITIDEHGAPGSGGSNNTDYVTYTGRELLRVGAGVDFRLSRVIGFGLYGSVAFGKYDTVKDQVSTVSVDQGTHSTAQLGVRLILFP